VLLLQRVISGGGVGCGVFCGGGGGGGCWVRLVHSIAAAIYLYDAIYSYVHTYAMIHFTRVH